MDYYQCQTEVIQSELRRRGYIIIGPRERLNETLKEDDAARGSEATTVTTKDSRPITLNELKPPQTTRPRKKTAVSLLVDERIIYWTMNTFFPSLQLFFESGRLCTIESGRFPGAMIGLDAALRFRLTDCSHEEDGRIKKSIQPEKFAHISHGIGIKEATIAQRTSVVVKSGRRGPEPMMPRLDEGIIAQEVHAVVGLKLEGMTEIAYVWARSMDWSPVGNRYWYDARPTGIRNDVPPPHLGFPMHLLKPGGEVAALSKKSQMKANVSPNGQEPSSLRPQGSDGLE